MLVFVPLLGALGVAGLAVLIAADLLLVWTPARNLDVFRAAEGKSDRRVVAGALLGVFAIPFVLPGIGVIYYGLAPAGPWLALPPVLLASFAYVIGAGFHAAIGPFMIAVRDRRDSPESLAAMKRIFDVLRTALWISIFASSISLFAVILSGRTAYPRWAAALSPLPLVLTFRIVGRFGPPAIAGAVVPAGGNVATLIFLVVSIATLP
jgi:hypothetical protein